MVMAMSAMQEELFAECARLIKRGAEKVCR